jgi:hypothetical protein
MTPSELEAIRARDAEFSAEHMHTMTYGVQDRRALLAHVDELLAERALLVTRAENAEAALVEADRNEETLLGMIRHQRDVLRECLPYINESMAGRRPGRCADDIRAAVKALTADSGDERNG